MSFQRTFQQTDVTDCLKPGIQALGEHSHLIENDTPREFQGSVDIDSCLARQYPQDNRWDYAFGYEDRTYYVEVHHVGDSEVRVVIAKYQWLKAWQNRQPNPLALKTDSYYYWVSSGRGSLTKGSRYIRQLALAGLAYPVKRLRMQK